MGMEYFVTEWNIMLFLYLITFILQNINNDNLVCFHYQTF